MAAFGGFLRLSFRDPEATVEPIALDQAFAAELERRMLLCYTGDSRFSGDTIGRVMRAYEEAIPRSRARWTGSARPRRRWPRRSRPAISPRSARC